MFEPKDFISDPKEMSPKETATLGEAVFGSPGNPVVDLDENDYMDASTSKYIKREEPEPLMNGTKSDEPQEEKKDCCHCLFSFKFKKKDKESGNSEISSRDIKNAPGV